MQSSSSLSRARSAVRTSLAKATAVEAIAPGARVEIRDEEWMVRTDKAAPGLRRPARVGRRGSAEAERELCFRGSRSRPRRTPPHLRVLAPHLERTRSAVHRTRFGGGVRLQREPESCWVSMGAPWVVMSVNGLKPRVNPMTRKRESHYPERLNVNVSATTMAALQRGAERHGIAVGVLARAALVRGLPAALKAFRKARQQEPGS